MENSKVIKRILLGLLCILILALIVFSVFQHLQFEELSWDMNYKADATDVSSYNKSSDADRVAQNNIPQGAAPMDSLKDSDKTDLDEVEERLDATEERLDKAHQKLSDELLHQAEVKKKEEGYYKQMSADSKKKDQDKFTANLDTEYGPLFNELNLSPDKLSALKQLLIDKRQESIDISVKKVDGMTWSTMSDNPVKVEEYNEKIRQLLGNTDYEKYTTYEDSSGERYRVSNFIKSVYTGETLTDDQKYALIESMYKYRESIADELEGYGTPADSPYVMDEEEIGLRMKRTERTHEAYIEAAKDILSPAQTEQFETYFKELRDRLESNYRLQAETFGKKATQNDADETSE